METMSTAAGAAGAVPVVAHEARKTILIATMEYDIEDWQIKIKIGGLGVMSQVSLPQYIAMLALSAILHQIQPSTISLLF